MANKIIIAPTGKYSIGLSKYDLYDEYRNNKLIPLQVYFPSHQNNNAPYEKVYETRGSKEFTLLKNMVFAKLDSTSNIAQGKFPLVFFSHGNNAIMTDYATINEEIASNGFIVVCIQHQLHTDSNPPKFWESRSCSKHSSIIDDILYVFEWIKTNNANEFYGKIDSDKTALIGHSMGGNALLMLANRTSGIFRKSINTLLLHDNFENVKECIVFIDGELQFPYPKKYPILFCLSEERKDYQVSSGTAKLLEEAGYEYKHYKGSKHISFMDHAYLGEFPNNIYFDGTKQECEEFYISLRSDILRFIRKNLVI